jgi:hypothetical protein
MKLFLLSAFLFFASCANQNRPQDGRFPDWYNNPPVSSEKFFYATGKGTQKENAIKNALYSFSKQMKSLATSHYKDLERSDKDFFKNIIEENITSEVSKISTSGFKISKMEKLSKDEFVVLGEIRKSLVSAQYNEKLRRLDKELSEEIAREDFKFLRDRYTTQGHLAEMRLVLKILSSFGEVKDKEHQQESDYRRRFFGRLNGLSFRIVKNSEDFSQAERIIEQAIRSAGYKVADGNQSHSFLVSITGRVQKSMQGRLFSAKQRIEIRIQSERGDVFAAKIIEESSSSNLSYTDALANSGAELRNQLKRKGVESFFEFEN